MRAAYYEANGPAREVLRVGDILTPQAGPGVNPSDVKARQGSRKIAWPQLIPQSDGAGVIDQVGDGVPKSRIGERVWVWNGQWKRPFGTAAEYIALPAAMAVNLPDTISFEEGACLGIPAMTAAHAVELAGAVKGKTLFVSGGAGSVSQYIIQFAKADHIIDYKRDNVGDKVMELTGKRGADAMIEMDIVANAKLLPSVLRPKGSVIIYGTGGPEAVIPSAFCLSNSIKLQYFMIYELDSAERNRAIAAITTALAKGTLKNRVAHPTYKLVDIVSAHEAVELGTLGNVIVRM
jgi:NADPH2:quinone reductase